MGRIGTKAMLLIASLMIAFWAQNGMFNQSVMIVEAFQANSQTRQIAYGRKLFLQYCASCHGLEGKGDGPVVAALRSVPPDLTRIPKDNKGRFPVESLMRSISGMNKVPAHGSREMPVWGGTLGKEEIISLVKYLESIQKPF